MSDLSDFDLIEDLRTGKLSAFKKLFDAKYAQFYAFINSMVKDPFEAEDITQNIFMKVWVNKSNLNSTQLMHNYLFVLAKNEVRDYFRKKRNVSSSVVVDENIQLSYSQEIEGSIDAKAIKEQVELIISKMPSQRQKVFKLSREKLLTNQEVAKTLGLSTRTVERHIMLALKDIRTCLPAFHVFLFNFLIK